MLSFYDVNTNLYQLQKKITNSIKPLIRQSVIDINFIDKYYIRNEYIWQDGFLFDFLQKKTADLWVRQFVIYTGFIFSERFIFENIVRFYLNYLILPGHKFSFFETSNVSEMLNIIIYTYLLMFLVFIMLHFMFFI